MAGLTWDDTGKRLYETGTDRGVLFPTDDTGAYTTGVAWNGLTKVTEKPDGAEETVLYADNLKYLSLMSEETFKGSIEAYTFPDEFNAADGTRELGSGITVGQQARKSFGLAYRTLVGNDVKANDFGYKIHLVYGAKVSPSEREYESVNDDPGAVKLSWEFSTTPVALPNYKPVAHLIFDSTKMDVADLKKLEDMIYGNGTEATEPKLPLPSELATMFPKP